MNAFRFNLQTVLRLRQQQEEASAVGLARARSTADEARKAREDLEAVREAGRTRLSQAHGAGGPVGHLQNMALVVGSVDALLERAEVECVKADEQVEESRKAYHAAFQQRRTMDQLRTRRLEEWRTAQNKHEQQTMDEVALTRHARAGASPASGE
jgi:flagellar export protein FliJ